MTTSAKAAPIHERPAAGERTAAAPVDRTAVPVPRGSRARAASGADAVRAAYRPAAVWASVLAGTVFVVVLCGGHASLLQRAPAASDFFDAQAHSLLQLRWNVPAHALSIEGFVLHGRTYEYFGPLPAILRLPVAAVTDTLDGRLGQLSMIAAYAVAMVFTYRIAARVRPLVRCDTITRRETRFVGAFLFVVGAGSVFTFLASRSWAYHESELWGAALALGAYEWIVAYACRPSRRNLALAAGFTLLAMLVRGSVASGPVVALALMLVASRWDRARRLAGLPLDEPVRPLHLLGAVLAPIGAYAYVNFAKFGTLFSLPFRAQVSSRTPANRALLDLNHGSMFNLGLLPTNVHQYLGSGPMRIVPVFPWVTFPAPTQGVGSPRIAWTWASSFPAAMPMLTILAAVGLIAVFGTVARGCRHWRRCAHRSSAPPRRPSRRCASPTWRSGTSPTSCRWRC